MFGRRLSAEVQQEEIYKWKRRRRIHMQAIIEANRKNVRLWYKEIPLMHKITTNIRFFLHVKTRQHNPSLQALPQSFINRAIIRLTIHHIQIHKNNKLKAVIKQIKKRRRLNLANPLRQSRKPLRIRYVNIK